MRANFEDDEEVNDGYLIVFVNDNNNVEHEITFDETTSEIVYHGQDGYPDDPEKRSMIDEVEPINQARRYAKYYVNRERGYDTIKWRQDPARMLAAALTITGMDTAAVSDYFGTLYDQVRSHHTDIDRPITLPTEVRPGHIVYQQDIYLGLNDQTLRAVDEFCPSSDETESYDGTASIDEIVSKLLAAAEADAELPDFSALTIEAVSGVHLRWDDASGTYHHQRNGEPAIDSDPTARLDVMPAEPTDIAAFRFQLVHNLICQVRDCYIEMGVTPPESVRIQGLGKQQTSSWYDHYEFYQRYHDPEADIDWEIEPPEHRDE